ncbi:hypothetical protein [Pseudofrankia sp. DC12]|uniref:hypothetical protein n=1 Tax=Pseudofrankia sp. DC12 TaxID=683315 RepID=UPI000B27BE40|nr:hypothetical protein [Pseudofrankia sp. DC12]
MKQSLLEGEQLTLGGYLTVESARYLALLTGAGTGEVAGRLAERRTQLRPTGE